MTNNKTSKLEIKQRWQSICDQIAIAEKMASISMPKASVSSTDSENNLINPTSNQRIVATIAVSKRQAVDSIQQAYQAGARLFGESFIQEAIPKIQQLQQLKDIEWHFIGPIQSNKTRQIAENFDWVHSLSRDKIARRLSEQRPTSSASINVLIQVNISLESTKSGVSVEQMLPLAKIISELPQLSLRGIMCIPEKSSEVKIQADNFHRMHKLFKTVKHFFRDNPAVNIDTLSMGMSGDYQEAILAGSNMVRIGTAIFGSRD